MDASLIVVWLRSGMLPDRPPPGKELSDAKIAAIICHTVCSAGGESADDGSSRQIPAFPAAAIEFAARSIYASCYAAKYSLFRLQGIAGNPLLFNAESGWVRGRKRKFPASREYHGPRPS